MIDQAEIERELEYQQYWNSIPDHDKLLMIAAAREYVSEVWRNVQLYYRDPDRNGSCREVAIGVGQTVLDNYDQVVKKQTKVQIITEWYRWDIPQLRLKHEAMMWAEAFGFTKYSQNRKGKKAPEYDIRTRYSIWCQQQQKPTAIV